MSGFWASSRLREVLLGLLLVGLAIQPASARVHLKGRVLDDSGRIVSRIRISDDGVHLTRAGRDGNVDVEVVSDSLGHGAIVIDEGSGVVRFLSNAEVSPGERIDGDVVTIGGRIRVAGEVTGSTVSIFGSTEILPGAVVGGDAVAVMGGVRSSGQVSGTTVSVLGSTILRDHGTVGGDAVAVGGEVSEADSTRVAGQCVSLKFLPLMLGTPVLPAVLSFIALGWVLAMFFGWVFGALFPERLSRIAITSSRRTFLSIVMAVASLFLMPLMSLLLIFTLVGAPIGIMLWILFPAAAYAGQLSATYVLGCKILRRRLGDGKPFAPLAVGSLVLALFFAASAVLWTFPGMPSAVAFFLFLVGLLLITGLSTIGTGALMLSRFGATPRQAEVPPPMTPSAGASSATA